MCKKEGTVILRDICMGWGRPPIGELECITPCSLLRETLSFCKPCPAAVSLGRQKIRVPDVKYNYNIVHSPCPMWQEMSLRTPDHRYIIYDQTLFLLFWGAWEWDQLQACCHQRLHSVRYLGMWPIPYPCSPPKIACTCDVLSQCPL